MSDKKAIGITIISVSILLLLVVGVVAFVWVLPKQVEETGSGSFKVNCDVTISNPAFPIEVLPFGDSKIDNIQCFSSKQGIGCNQLKAFADVGDLEVVIGESKSSTTWRVDESDSEVTKVTLCGVSAGTYDVKATLLDRDGNILDTFTKGNYGVQ